MDTKAFDKKPKTIPVLESFRLEGDCLLIRYSHSGCSGDSWKPELFDEGIVRESFPVQRTIRFHLENEEMCLAFITKEASFDLSPLKDKAGPVQFKLQNTGAVFQY